MSTPGLVGSSIAGRARMTIRVASIWSTTGRARAAIAAPESRATTALHAGADERRVGWIHQRHRLALHVRAHQRAVGVVVLEERDERRGDRDELVRRHVHELDLPAGHDEVVAGVAADHEVFDQRALASSRRVRLGDACTSPFHRREIDDLVVETLPSCTRRYGRLDEAVLVHAREVASELIRPMFGPSGVSIGQMRP